MGEETNLRSVLVRTDNSSQTIQSSAASMMRLYDKSPALSVSEWRNALQSCHNSQLLPLLYVVNEVLQSSKRNRGNRFLEEFSPVLKATLQFICERDRDVVEKVRRTVKIWGDRRVFSVRFVMDLLGALESFRSNSALAKSTTLSPSHFPREKKLYATNSSSNTISYNESDDENEDEDSTNERSQKRKAMGKNDKNAFSFSKSGPSLLGVDNLMIGHMEVTKTTGAPATSQHHQSSRFPFGSKRRQSEVSVRGINANTIGSNVPHDDEEFSGNWKRKLSCLGNDQPNYLNESVLGRRRPIFSITAFGELFDQMNELDEQFVSVHGIISSMTSLKAISSHEDDEEEENIMDKVGDELIELNQQVNGAISTVRNQKRILHSIAERKRLLEGEIRRYQPWLENALHIDDDELRFCEELKKKLRLIKVIHADAKKSRERNREKEAKEQAIAEASARKKAEEEELKQALEKTMKNTDEPKEGMVWNKQLREYQYLPDVTEESWRD